MGIIKGDRENYLNLYMTLHNKSVIEDIVSEKIEDLKWEYYYEGKKIDIFAVSDSGKTIFIENQITMSDERHLLSVKEIIERASDDSIVIWGALGFSSEMMKCVSAMFQEIKDKKIEFFAVEINVNVLPVLERLNSMHVLKVIDNLKLLDSIEIFNDIFDKYATSFAGDTEKNQYRYKPFTERERTNSYIIKELRNKVKYPNIFREKRTIDINRIRYGFGRAGIDVDIVFSKNYVSCQFNNTAEEIYREVIKRKDALEKKIGTEVVCDEANMRVVTFVTDFEHKFDKIDQLVELMDKYIFYLSNYTFYFGKSMQDEMWKQHKEGLFEI